MSGKIDLNLTPFNIKVLLCYAISYSKIYAVSGSNIAWKMPTQNSKWQKLVFNYLIMPDIWQTVPDS